MNVFVNRGGGRVSNAFCHKTLIDFCLEKLPIRKAYNLRNKSRSLHFNMKMYAQECKTVNRVSLSQSNLRSLVLRDHLIERRLTDFEKMLALIKLDRNHHMTETSSNISCDRFY